MAPRTFGLATPVPDLLAYAAQKRWEKEVGGTTVGGMAIHTDDRSKSLITGARMAAEADPDFTTDWKAADGSFVTIDATTIVAVSNAVLAHVASCFAIEAQVLDITLQRSPIETRPLPDEQSLTASLFASAATDDEWLRIMALRRSGRTLETVKGLIEPVLLSDGWALQWRQTDPPAEPFVLIRRILAYEWSVLPVSIETREWLDIIRAGYDEQFPMAVRLVAETQDGPPIDWMFECIVTVSLNEEWR